MTYQTKKNLLLLFFVPLLLTNFVLGNSNGINYASILLIIIITGTAFIQFELRIGQSSLTYTMRMFHLPIYQQIINPNEIRQINFKRMGWTKGVQIKRKNNSNLRLHRFFSNEIFSDLHKFAGSWNLPVTKKKDFGRL